jgi:hypothetical protein
METLPHTGPTQFASIKILWSIISSECGHHVDSQIMHMVRYGTQLLIVENVDKTWHIYGIAQYVDSFLLILAVWSNGDDVDGVNCHIWQKTEHWSLPMQTRL